MSAVVIGSINCRGLSNNVKRCDIFNKCRDMFDISILVDTQTKRKTMAARMGIYKQVWLSLQCKQRGSSAFLKFI